MATFYLFFQSGWAKDLSAPLYIISSSIPLLATAVKTVAAGRHLRLVCRPVGDGREHTCRNGESLECRSGSPFKELTQHCHGRTDKTVMLAG